MEQVIVTLAAFVAALLQIVLIFFGLGMLDRAIFLSLRSQKAEWVSLWGGWHLIVLAVILTLMNAEYTRALEVLKTDDFQADAIRTMAIWLWLPLITSFILSLLHYLAREHFAKNP